MDELRKEKVHVYTIVKFTAAHIVPHGKQSYQAHCSHDIVDVGTSVGV